MGELQVKYGIMENNAFPLFCIEILSSDINDVNVLIHYIVKIFDLAVTLYNALVVVQDKFWEASINEQFPVGACAILCFKSKDEGYEFKDKIGIVFQ